MSIRSDQPVTAGIVAPPPVLYLGTLAAAFAVDAVLPLPILPFAWGLRVLGVLLLVAGGAFARWAFVTMRRAGTRASPRKQATALAVNGPFRLSRNPIYLAMTALYLGVALLGNSWWALLLLPPLLGIMHWGVLLREERYLEQQFGERYSAYKSVTRRWL